MSVIIRLQNLPWSANAQDIRRFFKGLSIPEGGVHIVGGENGDAFIAFSTDEDARQAMMHDREKINEVQVRLLLSSRAEMQKVIESARQLSLLALQNAGAIPAKIVTPIPTPQPPVITTNNLQNILSNPLGAAPSFLAYQQQAGITLTSDKPIDISESTSRRSSTETTRDRRRSDSKERRRSRDRNDRTSSRRRRSRSRSRDRDYKGRRPSRRSSRERSSEKSRDRSRDRSRRNNRNSKEKDTNYGNRSGDKRDNYNNNNKSNGSGRGSDSGRGNDSVRGNDSGRANDSVRSNDSGRGNDSVNENIKPKPAGISPWSIPPINAYQTSFRLDATVKNSPNQFSNTNVGNLGGNLSGNLINPYMAAANVRNAMPNAIVPNAYTTSSNKDAATISTPNMANLSNASPVVIPAFQNYTSTANNYSVNMLGSSNSNSNDSSTLKPFQAFQNPYTAALQAASLNTNSQDSNSSSTLGLSTLLQNNSATFPGLFMDKNSEGTLKPSTTTPALTPSNFQQSQLPQQQEPIAFASTNPYAQMYPNLFAQAGLGGPATNSKAGNLQQQAAQDTGSSRDENKNNDRNFSDSCCIKISNMCGSTTYSDIRKFFAGLFIPHNGIKMVNDKHGLRIGIAYIQFSRISSIHKAMMRNNTIFKAKPIRLEAVSDEEFENTEDSFRPHNRFDRGGGGGDRPNYGNSRNDYENRHGGEGNNDNNSMSDRMNPFGGSEKSQEPFTVLYVDDIPSLATEQDIMRMFSSFTIFDILLTSSPENRREFIAHVKFSREDEAKAALADKNRHMIGHRKVRVRSGTVEDMERAKEKLRLANEQLKKEEQELAEEESKQRKLKEDEDEAAAALKNEKNEENIDEDDDDDDVILVTSSSSDGPSDPRLRRAGKPNRFEGSGNQDSMNSNSNNDAPMPQMRNFNPNFNENQHKNFANPMESNFVILKNCDYNARINDVAELLMTSNLRLQHIEPLCTDNKMPSGEFIVEFQNAHDSKRAVEDFNNTSFRSRNLRVRSISPQEIADRLGKPFMNHFPGGGGGGRGRGGGPNGPNMLGDFGFFNRGGSGGGNMMNFRGGGNMDMRFGNNMPMRRGGGGSGGGGMPFGGGPMRGNRRGNMGSNFNNNDQKQDRDDVNMRDKSNMDNDDDDGNASPENDHNTERAGDEGSTIPEKFNRPGCVVAMENVPFKADLKEIMQFFSDFELTPDDIIRRFNDDGSPTGDARVAFNTPAIARAAFDAKKRKCIFNRIVYLNIL